MICIMIEHVGTNAPRGARVCKLTTSTLIRRLRCEIATLSILAYLTSQPFTGWNPSRSPDRRSLTQIFTPLSGLYHLTTLSLNNTQIGDPGIVYLAKLDKLRHLDLHQTQVSDDGVKHFSP